MNGLQSAQNAGHRVCWRIPETRGMMETSRIPKPARLVLVGMYPDPSSTSLPGLVGPIIFHEHVQWVCAMLVAPSIQVNRIHTKMRGLLFAVQRFDSAASS